MTYLRTIWNWVSQNLLGEEHWYFEVDISCAHLVELLSQEFPSSSDDNILKKIAFGRKSYHLKINREMFELRTWRSFASRFLFTDHYYLVCRIESDQEKCKIHGNYILRDVWKWVGVASVIVPAFFVSALFATFLFSLPQLVQSNNAVIAVAWEFSGVLISSIFFLFFLGIPRRFFKSDLKNRRQLYNDLSRLMDKHKNQKTAEI